MTTNWCGNVKEYQDRTRVVNWEDFELQKGDNRVDEQRFTGAKYIWPITAIAAAVAVSLIAIRTK